jgi:hypothetical protein
MAERDTKLRAGRLKVAIAPYFPAKTQKSKPKNLSENHKSSLPFVEAEELQVMNY